MSWPGQECFRDPTPISRDYVLASHAPADRLGLFVVDRYGNREMLYLDPAIGSMCRHAASAGVSAAGLSALDPQAAEEELGQFTLADVYQGLGPRCRGARSSTSAYARRSAPRWNNCPTASSARTTPLFQDFYATPVHLVTGPYGWPSYVAKASLGTVPVEPDGSANFYAPAGKVLYFEVLDEN